MKTIDGRLQRFVSNRPQLTRVMEVGSDRLDRVTAIVVGSDRPAKFRFVVGADPLPGEWQTTAHRSLVLTEDDLAGWPVLPQGHVLFIEQLGTPAVVQGAIVYGEECKG
jgi:hypothetical protein